MPVLLKALALAGVAFSLVSASPPNMTPAEVPSSMQLVLYPLIHKVSCDEGSGTAFRVGSNHWLSVAHVATLSHCAIDGSKVTTTEIDGAHDFARMDTTDKRSGFRVNCGGFVPGHWYWAIGHAKGLPFQTAIALYATYAKSPDGKRVLIGEYAVIPGMSGGPVLDDAGQVVGTVNAYIVGTTVSLSRELKDTSVCGADIA
jgi:hypothetical protein